VADAIRMVAGKGRLPHTGEAMRRFRVYRPHPPEEYLQNGSANPPEEVQFEGVVFSDGTVCVRWLTARRSHSVWASMDDLLEVHGHPEYGTKLVWMD
jgi:hypothetical protein